jgi:hypothetical protein
MVTVEFIFTGKGEIIGLPLGGLMTLPMPKEGYPPYQFVEFPKWKYHREGEGRIVANRDEELSLGADWYDTPAEAQKALEAGSETQEQQ